MASAAERIRVAWVIPTLVRGGAEKQLSLLARHIDRSRFEPVVVTLTSEGPYAAELDAANVDRQHIGKRGKFDPLALQRLKRTLQQLRPDVVHTYLFAGNAYGRWAALRAGVPVVFGGERSVDPWKRNWQLIIDRFLAGRSTGILTNSTAIVDFYSERGIDRAKFTVIFNGVERPNVQLSREEIARRIGISPSKRWIVSIGRLWPQKGYKELIWAGSMLGVADPETVYLVIGDGPQRPQLQTFVNQIGGATTIRLLGDRPDAAEILQHADVLWNGSQYEGQSNAILEAMALGVPVVASDIPGNRDLIVHDQHGFLVSMKVADDLIKATRRMQYEPAERERIVQAAKRRVETEFSVDAMVRRHEEVYAAAVAASR